MNDRHAYFDRLARMSASAVAAPLAIITIRKARTLTVIGAFGTRLDAQQDNWRLTRLPLSGKFVTEPRQIEFVPNIKTWNDVIRTPITQFAPYVRKVLHVPIPIRSGARAAITIGQPAMRWPIGSCATTILHDLATLVGEGVDGEDVASVDTAEDPIRSLKHLAEPEPQEFSCSQRHDIAGQFLVATLNSRTAVRTRGGVSYIVLRTWSSRIKDYQIKALKIEKQHPSPDFVANVAVEIVLRLEKLMAVRSLNCVVPVPCGHSRREACLSTEIARAVATRLNIPFRDALRAPRRSGQSHPRKNVDLTTPEMNISEHLGTVLLVDDVATSGRHIEVAAKALAHAADHVTAVAWIGG